MTLARVDEGGDIIRPDLSEWAAEMVNAAHIARGLAGTSFVPESLRVVKRGVVDLDETTAQVAAALLAGKEVGLEPMAALRSIYIVGGTPAFYAVAARALAIARGHQIEVVESTATRCIMRGRRRGADHWLEPVNWNMDRARQLGLRGFNSPDGPWKRQPQNMLIARATAECVRLTAPEVLLALPYVVEELQDADPDGTGPETPPLDSSPAPPPKRTARRRNPPQAAGAGGAPSLAPTQASPLGDEPPLDEPPKPESAGGPVPGETLITTEQSRALHAGLRDIGLDNRDEALPEISGWIGRDIASTNELTRREASVCLAEIDRVKTARALAEAQQEEEHGYGVQQDLDDWLQGGGEESAEPPPDDDAR